MHTRLLAALCFVVAASAHADVTLRVGAPHVLLPAVDDTRPAQWFLLGDSHLRCQDEIWLLAQGPADDARFIHAEPLRETLAGAPARTDAEEILLALLEFAARGGRAAPRDAAARLAALADAGHDLAAYVLGKHAETTSVADEAQVTAYLRQAARAGVPGAAFDYATSLYWKADPGEDAPFLWLTRAADAGDVRAQLRLGNSFAQRAETLGDEDYALAREYLARAANGGDLRAQSALAALLVFSARAADAEDAWLWTLIARERARARDDPTAPGFDFLEGEARRALDPARREHVETALKTLRLPALECAAIRVSDHPAAIAPTPSR